MTESKIPKTDKELELERLQRDLELAKKSNQDAIAALDKLNTPPAIPEIVSPTTNPIIPQRPAPHTPSSTPLTIHDAGPVTPPITPVRPPVPIDTAGTTVIRPPTPPITWVPPVVPTPTRAPLPPVPPVILPTPRGPTGPMVQTPEQIRLEKSLEDARIKYAEAYKKFLSDRKQGLGMFTKSKEKVMGVKVDDSEIPPELKTLEHEYNVATIKYGQEMLGAKREELENSLLSDEDKKIELAKYKQKEIFTKIIVEEQSKLNSLKAENLPPKEKNAFKKGLDWYLRQSRTTKMAISVIGGTAIFAVLAPGSVAAAGGVATYAGIRALRGVVGMTAGQVATKAYDLIFKDKSAEERSALEKELSESQMFSTNLKQTKKAYEAILEEEQKTKRKRLITKAAIGIAAGIGASIETGHLLHHTPGQIHTETPKSPQIHKDVNLSNEHPQAPTSDTTHPPGVNTEAPHSATPSTENTVPTSGPATTPTMPSSADSQMHDIHRDGWINDNQLKTFWGGEKGTGIDVKGNYVLDVSHIPDGDKILFTPAGSGQALELTVSNHQAIIDPTSDIGKMFTVVNGHAQFNGKFVEVGQDMGNEHFKILSTVVGGGKDLAHTTSSATAASQGLPKVGSLDMSKAGIHTEKLGDAPMPPALGISAKPFDMINLEHNKVEMANNISAVDTHAHIQTAEEIARAKVEAGFNDLNNVTITGHGAGGSNMTWQTPMGPRVESTMGPTPGVNTFYQSNYSNNLGNLTGRAAIIANQGYAVPGYGGGANVAAEHNFPGLSVRDNITLRTNPLFSHNPLHLAPDRLVQVYQTYQSNLSHLFPANSIDDWKELRDLKAEKVIGNLTFENDPQYASVVKYLHKLMYITHLTPKGRTGLFHGPETLQKFIVRNLQEAAKQGRLKEARIE